MGLLSNLMSKIFSHSGVATVATGGASAAPAATSSPASAQSATAPAATPPSTAAPAGPAKVVDVAAILDGLAAKNPEKLDW